MHRSVRDRSVVLQELERRRDELVQQLQQHQGDVRRSIFNVIRAGLASHLLPLLKSNIFRVDERDYNESTPLHIAAHEGRQDICSMLVGFGADPTAVDSQGRTPRDVAVANRHTSIGTYLLGASEEWLTKQRRERRKLMAAQQQQQQQLSNAPPPSGGEDELTDENVLQYIYSPEIDHSVMSSTATDEGAVRGDSFTQQSAAAVVASSAVFGTTPTDPIAAAALCGVHRGAGRRLVPAMSTSSGGPLELSHSAALHDIMLVEEEEDNLQFSHFSTISDNVSLVLCMVGLPGRGKSFISRRISRYLNWKGVPCRVFNAGNYRRTVFGVKDTTHAAFFDPNDTDAKNKRELMAQMACDDLVAFLQEHPVGVGILDATNTTKERRSHLIRYFEEKERDVLQKPCRVLFLESICTDDGIITENILRSKCSNDDYKHVKDTNAVIVDFRDRIRQYEKVYQPLHVDENVSFIKIINVKEQLVFHNVHGGLGSRIIFLLLNLHPVAFPLYVALHGETEGNRNEVFGGEERLTERGKRMAENIRKFVEDRCGCQATGPQLLVLHGTNPAVLATVSPLKELEEEGLVTMCPSRCLDDMNFGRMNGETFPSALQHHPKLSQLLFVATAPSGASPYQQQQQYAQPAASPSGTAEATTSTTAAAAAANKTSALDILRHQPTSADPRLNYCVQFPGGESCRQVNVRLESALMHVMRCGMPVLVVAPPVPAQGVVAFFTDVRPELSPSIRIPSQSIVEVTIKAEVMLYPQSTDEET